MYQQAKYMKTHILDLSDNVNISLQNPLIGQNKQILHPLMSDKELKIRGELEMDVERDLEHEIKDGIYYLAIRLHRLYQHKKERNSRSEESHNVGAKNNQEAGNKILSELNISIKLEGGSKIEIKETKKELTPDQEKGIRQRTSTARSGDYNNLKGMTINDAKKFNWARSLRSSSGHVEINRRNIGRAHDYMDMKNITTSAAGQRKGIDARGENKVLELGWKW